METHEAIDTKDETELLEARPERWLNSTVCFGKLTISCKALEDHLNSLLVRTKSNEDVAHFVPALLIQNFQFPQMEICG